MISGDGTWRFVSAGTGGHTFTDEWAAIYNPYAKSPQASFDWFVFDKNSVMVTGWHTDTKDGNRYYLWPVMDGTQGHMVVGYQYIGGAWYFFNEKSDGTRGKLIVNATVTALDGTVVTTNAAGQIVVGGKVVTDPAAFTATVNTNESLKAAGVAMGLK